MNIQQATGRRAISSSSLNSPASASAWHERPAAAGVAGGRPANQWHVSWRRTAQAVAVTFTTALTACALGSLRRRWQC